MNVWSIIRGIMGNLFGIGGPDGINIKENSGVAELRNAADNEFAAGRALRLQPGATINDIATAIDIQGATPNIEFGFAGGSAPSPGDNETLFGFCHTSGGLYTAGDVVYDDGTTTLSSFKIPFAKTITVGDEIVGTISLIANGLYALQNGTWTLKGDGGGAETGRIRLIEIPFTHSGGDIDSTTPLPNGARVIRTDVRVLTAFNGTTPSVSIKAQGSTPLTLLAAAGVDLTTVGQYTSDEIFEIDSDSAGSVRADITVSGASTGAAKALVTYTTATLS